MKEMALDDAELLQDEINIDDDFPLLDIDVDIEDVDIEDENSDSEVDIMNEASSNEIRKELEQNLKENGDTFVAFNTSKNNMKESSERPNKDSSEKENSDNKDGNENGEHHRPRKTSHCAKDAKSMFSYLDKATGITRALGPAAEKDKPKAEKAKCYDEKHIAHYVVKYLSAYHEIGRIKDKVGSLACHKVTLS